MNAMLLTDGYKLDHRRQYPRGTEYVYSNWTARSNNYLPEAQDGVVVFGIQYFVKKYLIEYFNKEFFSVPKEKAVESFSRRINTFLGPNEVGDQHIVDLWELGYLPIKLKALPEGSVCPIRVPMLTVVNTHPDFFWVTNFLETLMSCELWMPMTSATIARIYRKELERHAEKTGFDKNIELGFLCHDFSMRGMAGLEASITSGMAHLTSFIGSETIPAIEAVEKYYCMDAEKELIASTVPATEHSVMCAGGLEDEFGTFKRLITETYPKGFVSIVSDTWDFWKVISEFMPRLYDEIMSRDGRLVIRPDSGIPEDIICGIPNENILTIEDDCYYIPNIGRADSIQIHTYTTKIKENPKELEKYKLSSYQIKGAYECLWDIFGGVVNEKGYKVLDSHIGIIYGDSITMDRQKEIYKRLEEKGFAATNLVLGIGSYTYQYRTRDSLGFAMKATWCQINDEGKEIFKQPKTDSGMKNSLKGLIQDLGADNTYKIKKDAAINKANAEKEIQIAESDAKKAANDVQVKNETEIAERNNELAIRKADLQRQSDSKKAEADAAYEIQAQEQLKTVNEKTVDAQIARTKREQILAEEQVKVTENKLKAEINAKADADKYNIEVEAKAKLEQQKREAEAKAYLAEQEAKAVKAKADAAKYAALQEAEGIKAKGIAEAEATQAKLTAEAEGIRAKGDAEAEAMDKKAEAYKKSEFAKLEMVLEMQKTVLPQVAENVAKPMSAIGDVTIYGQNGSEISGISQNVPVVMKKTFDIVKDTTGVNLADVMRSETIEAKVTKNVNLNGAVDLE